MRYILGILTVVTLSFVSCEDKEKDDPIIYDISGILARDANGSLLGCHPFDCADDWQWGVLDSEEKELLNFNDNISLQNAGSEAGSDAVFAYPCPIGRNGDMAFFLESNANLKFKIAAVDSLRNVYNTASIVTKSGGTTQFILDQAWFDSMPSQSAIRIYYGLFGKDGYITGGYGDIAICPEGVGGADYLDCFPK